MTVILRQGIAQDRPAPRGLAGEKAVTLAWPVIMSVTALSAWLAVVGALALAKDNNLWGAVNGARGRMIGPGLAVFIVVVMMAEQRWPAERRPLLARAHLVDAGYLALYAVFVIPLLTLVNEGFYLEINHHAPWLVLARAPVVPRVGIALVIIVAMDGLLWAAHVANHRFRSLWRLHALHHSQEDLSVFTTFRTHPLIHATYLPGSVLPALVLGASGGVPAWGLVAYGCLVTLPHANLNWGLGPLGRVIVSPAYHRVHHARDLGPQGNVNFGFALVVWDRLAHRAVFPSGVAPLPTGISDRSVPVEQLAAARALPGVVAAQLAQPFRRYSTTDGPRG
jgi:sterol desaturase/sphingolipid hydroxylase (fatty acid hydroxylase superfamily)